MTKKLWKDLSEPQKIEDLRQDVARLFDKLNWLTSDVQKIWGLVNEDHSKLSEVSKVVERIESQRSTVRPRKAVAKKKKD